LDSLSATQAHHDYITVSEEIGKIGDAFPLVLVDLRQGREQWRKEKFAKATAEVWSQALGCEPSHVFVIFRESPGSKFWDGDGFLETFNPEDHP
jgi:phenylpyruvate tautomerase PptA (4-oxalocrotonate tautomerase family)